MPAPSQSWGIRERTFDLHDSEETRALTLSLLYRYSGPGGNYDLTPLVYVSKESLADLGRKIQQYLVEQGDAGS